MTDFQIDDRVVLLIDHPDNNDDLSVGATGTVCDIWKRLDDEGPAIGVEWDFQSRSFHRCNGSCADGYGWYVPDPSYLALLDDPGLEPSDMSLAVLL